MIISHFHNGKREIEICSKEKEILFYLVIRLRAMHTLSKYIFYLIFFYNFIFYLFIYLFYNFVLFYTFSKYIMHILSKYVLSVMFVEIE